MIDSANATATRFVYRTTDDSPGVGATCARISTFEDESPLPAAGSRGVSYHAGQSVGPCATANADYSATDAAASVAPFKGAPATSSTPLRLGPREVGRGRIATSGVGSCPGYPRGFAGSLC